MTTSHKLVLFALVLATATGLLGCGVFTHTGPSHVSRGQRFQSGVATYDKFFEELHSLQVQMHDAVKQEEAVRTELANDLGLESDASRKLIEKRVKKGTEQLAENAVAIKLEFIGLDSDDDEGDARVTTEGTTNSRDADFVEAIESGAKASARLVVRMRDVKRRARRLSALLPLLETNVDREFHLLGPARKSEVRRNLYDAKLILPLISDLSEEVSGDTLKLVAALEQVKVELPDSDADPNVGDYQRLSNDPTQKSKQPQQQPIQQQQPQQQQRTKPVVVPSAKTAPPPTRAASTQPADFQP